MIAYEELLMESSRNNIIAKEKIYQSARGE